MNRTHNTSSSLFLSSTTVESDGAYTRSRSAFTLIEVLISVIVLAIGLVGLAAVFPAVITQQRNATDLSAGLRAGASGEALLSNRLGDFVRLVDDLPSNMEGKWLRINAVESRSKGELPYLSMPNKPVDLRLGRVERDLRPRRRQLGNKIQFNFSSNRSPISDRAGDILEARIQLRAADGHPHPVIKLVPDTLDNTKFMVVTPPHLKDRLGANNSIDYERGTMLFTIDLKAGESYINSSIDFTWLDDRILSHDDRLFPKDNPRYAWDICIRKTDSGDAQYCLFVYRFDGKVGQKFNPDIPNSEGDNDSGMLRKGRFTVGFDSDRKRYFLEDPKSGDEKAAIKAGQFLLPVDGTGPIRVLRFVEGIGWELEAPPIQTDANGNARIMKGSEDFWFVPLSVYIERDATTWKLTPLVAYTKQLGV